MTVLTVRRLIRASAERIFDAWTQPKQLKQWWGPQSVKCVAAEVNLKVGGIYRIANQFSDGKILWISGEFEAVERPRRLVYTWQIGADTAKERVTVTIEARGDTSEVIVVHERIPTEALRDQHEQGWVGCLDGLIVFLATQS
jgi:uncharacterized protein YndB with AHSA1/START domain